MKGTEAAKACSGTIANIDVARSLMSGPPGQSASHRFKAGYVPPECGQLPASRWPAHDGADAYIVLAKRELVCKAVLATTRTLRSRRKSKVRDGSYWPKAEEPATIYNRSAFLGTADQFRSLGILRSLTRPDFPPGSERASGTTAALAHELGNLRLVAEFRPSEHSGVVLVVMDVRIGASVEEHAGYLDRPVFGGHMECRLVAVP
jgi:hypothetical protein